MKNISNQKGGISILGMLVLAFIFILVLSYFKISLRTVVESPESQDNIHYVAENTQTFWYKYLEKPANYLWNDVFLKIFWASFINNMERIRDGKPTDYEISAPTFPLGIENSNKSEGLKSTTE